MGRSGLIILIVIVLLAIGAYFVFHKKAGSEPSAPALPTASSTLPTPTPVAPPVTAPVAPETNPVPPAATTPAPATP